MIINCSSAVWKCQGTTHPRDAFRINVERPVAGSPVSTADDRHLTSVSGANRTVESGLMAPVAVSSASTGPLMKTARNPASFQFVCCVISEPYAYAIDQTQSCDGSAGRR